MPFPANYGGIIDVYYKLVWLKKAGIKIHLHCFTYGRQPAKELEELCEKVYYYPRKIGLYSGLSWMPYTVKSRKSVELEKNLLSNDFPILFEVLHTCYLLNDSRFKNRLKIYRHSNIEHEYYSRLAESEKSLSKKLYLKTEAKRLERFERIVNNADYILAVNEEDAAYFTKKYRHPKTIYLPSFHHNSEVNVKEGKGEYILYHGNLGISENYEAADWLIANVLSKTNHKAIIAGLRPPDFLKQKIAPHKNISLIENPSDEKMLELIQNAHIHCLHTPQATGLKLKLLNVLFGGRFILCNPQMLEGTGLKENESLLICHSKEDYIQKINSLYRTAFSTDFLAGRKKASERFDCSINVKKLVDLL
ncbi:MAG: mannosyltransferase [Bacteroidetes bacterium]|nr:mannosyltransferase [Bacteroidota bacterium]